jgi:hypothetical protein
MNVRPAYLLIATLLSLTPLRAEAVPPLRSFVVALGTGHLQDAKTLEPIYLTDAASKIRIKRVTPLGFGLVQLVGHGTGEDKGTLLSGFDLGLRTNTQTQYEAAMALLRSDLVLDTLRNANSGFNVLSLSMSQQRVLVTRMAQGLSSKGPAVELERDFGPRFAQKGGIFAGESVVLLGLEGMTSCLTVLSDDLSGDEKIIAKQTKFGDLSITGFDQLHRWNSDHFLVVATALSAEEQSMKRVWTLLRFDMKGSVTAASSPEIGPFSVFPSDGGVYLARRRGGASGEFQIIVEDLDTDLKVRKETVIPSDKRFPSLFELASSGNRPAIAVLGLNLIEIFDCTTGHSIFKFTPEHRVADLLGFHYIEGIPMLFVTVEDPVGKVRRCAYFELPKF